MDSSAYENLENIIRLKPLNNKGYDDDSAVAVVSVAV